MTATGNSEKDLGEALREARAIEERMGREIESLRAQLSSVEKTNDAKIDSIRDELELCVETLDALRKSVDDLGAAVMRHIQFDSERSVRDSAVDRERDQELSKVSSRLELLMAESGRSAGEEAGRKAANKFGPLWGTIGVVLSMIISGALQHCESTLPPQREKVKVEHHEHAGGE
jgi:uncharacterized protein YoxC